MLQHSYLALADWLACWHQASELCVPRFSAGTHEHAQTRTNTHRRDRAQGRTTNTNTSQHRHKHKGQQEEKCRQSGCTQVHRAPDQDTRNGNGQSKEGKQDNLLGNAMNHRQSDHTKGIATVAMNGQAQWPEL